MAIRQQYERYQRLLKRAAEAFEETGSRLSALNAQIERITASCETLEGYLQGEREPGDVQSARYLKQQALLRAHIQQTLQLQRQQLARLQEQQLALHRQWLEKRAEVRAFEKRIERLRQQLAQSERQAEQRQQDERSAWQAARQSLETFH